MQRNGQPLARQVAAACTSHLRSSITRKQNTTKAASPRRVFRGLQLQCSILSLSPTLPTGRLERRRTIERRRFKRWSSVRPWHSDKSVRASRCEFGARLRSAWIQLQIKRSRLKPGLIQRRPIGCSMILFHLVHDSHARFTSVVGTRLKSGSKIIRPI